MVNTPRRLTLPTDRAGLSQVREAFAQRYRKSLCDGRFLQRLLRVFYTRVGVVGARRGKRYDTQTLVSDHLHRRITTVAFMEGIAAVLEQATPADAYIARLDTCINTLHAKHVEAERLSGLIDTINTALDAQQAEDAVMT